MGELDQRLQDVMQRVSGGELAGFEADVSLVLLGAVVDLAAAPDFEATMEVLHKLSNSMQVVVFEEQMRRMDMDSHE